MSDSSPRKKWDTIEYKKRAEEKDKEERERTHANEKLLRQGKQPRIRPKEDLPKPTKSMQQRETPLELDKNLNRTMVVANPGGRGPGQPGFYCDVCKRNYRDTSAYLDHINSRSHLRALGQTTTIERSTLEQVRERISVLRAQTKERSTAHEFDFEKRLAEIRAQELAKREEKKRGRQAIRIAAQQVAMEGIDADAIELMGFSGFGSTKQR